MANLSTASRKEQVLHVLQAAHGDWVDGTELARAEVGGSEGLKRLRELRQEGWVIDKRKHPDPSRSIFQYRLATGQPTPTLPVAADKALQPGWQCQTCKGVGTGMGLMPSLVPAVRMGKCRVCKAKRTFRPVAA